MNLQEFERVHEIVTKWARLRNPFSREMSGLNDALAEGTLHITKLYSEVPLNPGTLRGAVNWLNGVIDKFGIEIPEDTSKVE